MDDKPTPTDSRPLDDMTRERLIAIFAEAMTAYYDLMENPPGIGKPYIDAKLEIQNTAVNKLAAELARVEVKTRHRAYNLLYWKYKEIAGQSVDMDFVEAYNILIQEAAHPQQAAELKQVDTTFRKCNLCGGILATGECTHVLVQNDRVIMTKKSWEKLTQQLNDLQAAEPEERQI